MLLEKIVKGEISSEEAIKSLDADFWRDLIYSNTLVRKKVEKVVDLNSAIRENPSSLRDYLKKEGVYSIDLVKTGNPLAIALIPLLQIKAGNFWELRNALLKTGVVPGRLSYYDEQTREKILMDAVKGKEQKKGRWHSIYFNLTNNEIMEENKRFLAHSPHFLRSLLSNSEDGTINREVHVMSYIYNGWEEIRKSTCRWKWSHEQKKFVNAIRKYGTYEPELSEHELRDDILEAVITKAQIPPYSHVSKKYALDEIWMGPWFDPEVVGGEAVEKNRTALLSSRPFLEYVNLRGINLRNPEEIRSDERLSKIFGAFLGIDLEEKPQESLARYFPTPSGRTNSEPLSSRIMSEWTEPQRKKLASEFQYMTEERILQQLRERESHIEEEYGRSTLACEMELRQIGVLPKQTIQQNGEKEIYYSYPFPKIHREEESQIARVFGNYASDFEAGREPSIIPVLAYGSKVTDELGRPQFFHVTTPIPYRGNDIQDYKPFEREILSKIAAYLNKPSSFRLETNNLRSELEEEPRILHIEDGQDHYAQVFLRTRLSDNPELISTAAIAFRDKEIYFFRHPQEKVTYGNTRK